VIGESNEELVNTTKCVSISNSIIVREKWVNLCLDLNSFIKRCFPKTTKETARMDSPTGHNPARASGGTDLLAVKQLSVEGKDL
jgi:hypothetical protein